jgi:hypothetical protein
MALNRSREEDSSSATYEILILCILCTLKIYCLVHTNLPPPPWIPILNQMNPVHIITPPFLQDIV